MSSFTAAPPPVLVPGEKRGAWRCWVFRLPGRPVYENPAEFGFYLGNPVNGRWVDIPAGFRTDLASIPVVVLWLLGPFAAMVMGLLAKAAMVHDRMREDLQFTLIECDCYFLIAMRADRVWKPLREVAFNMVRLNKSRDRAA